MNTSIGALDVLMMQRDVSESYHVTILYELSELTVTRTAYQLTVCAYATATTLAQMELGIPVVEPVELRVPTEKAHNLYALMYRGLWDLQTRLATEFGDGEPAEAY